MRKPGPKTRPQAWTIEGDLAYIVLRDRRVLIDAADVPLASRFRWKMNARGYVHGTGGAILHRVIMGLEKGDPREVDHRGREPWDNRRSELRFATRTQNCQNTAAKNRAGLPKGVTFVRGRFMARLMIYGRRIYLGRFETEQDAARAYADAARRLFGDFACVSP